MYASLSQNGNTQQVHTAIINLVVYMVGMLVMFAFYLNYYVFQDYFLALFWAMVLSIPLFQIKKKICEGLLDYFIGDVEEKRTEEGGEPLRLRDSFLKKMRSTSTVAKGDDIANSATSSGTFAGRRSGSTPVASSTDLKQMLSRRASKAFTVDTRAQESWWISFLCGVGDTRWWSRYESLGAFFLRDIPPLLDLVYRLLHFLAAQPFLNFLGVDEESASWPYFALLYRAAALLLLFRMYIFHYDFFNPHGETAYIVYGILAILYMIVVIVRVVDGIIFSLKSKLMKRTSIRKTRSVPLHTHRSAVRRTLLGLHSTSSAPVYSAIDSDGNGTTPITSAISSPAASGASADNDDIDLGGSAPGNVRSGLSSGGTSNGSALGSSVHSLLRKVTPARARDSTQDHDMLIVNENDDALSQSRNASDDSKTNSKDTNRTENDEEMSESPSSTQEGDEPSEGPARGNLPTRFFSKIWYKFCMFFRNLYFHIIATILAEQIHTLLAILIIVLGVVVGILFGTMFCHEMIRETLFLWESIRNAAESNLFIQQNVLPIVVGLTQALGGQLSSKDAASASDAYRNLSGNNSSAYGSTVNSTTATRVTVNPFTGRSIVIDPIDSEASRAAAKNVEATKVTQYYNELFTDFLAKQIEENEFVKFIYDVYLSEGGVPHHIIRDDDSGDDSSRGDFSEMEDDTAVKLSVRSTVPLSERRSPHIIRSHKDHEDAVDSETIQRSDKAPKEKGKQSPSDLDKIIHPPIQTDIEKEEIEQDMEREKTKTHKNTKTQLLKTGKASSNQDHGPKQTDLDDLDDLGESPLYSDINTTSTSTSSSTSSITQKLKIEIPPFAGGFFVDTAERTAEFSSATVTKISPSKHSWDYGSDWEGVNTDDYDAEATSVNDDSVNVNDHAQLNSFRSASSDSGEQILQHDQKLNDYMFGAEPTETSSTTVCSSRDSGWGEYLWSMVASEEGCGEDLTSKISADGAIVDANRSSSPVGKADGHLPDVTLTTTTSPGPVQFSIKQLTKTSAVLKQVFRGRFSDLSTTNLKEAFQELSEIYSSGAQELGRELLNSVGSPVARIFGYILTHIQHWLTAMLDVVFKVIVFLTAEFYLLKSRVSVLHYVDEFLAVIDSSRRCYEGVERVLRAILYSAVKMCVFYTVYTWFICSFFDVPLVFIPTLLSGIIALIPITDPINICFLANIWLYVDDGYSLWPNAGPCLAINAVVWWNVTMAIYQEIPDSNPWWTALGVVMGIAQFGVKGVIIGPILVVVPLLCYEMLSVFNLQRRQQMQKQGQMQQQLGDGELFMDTGVLSSTHGEPIMRPIFGERPHFVNGNFAGMSPMPTAISPEGSFISPHPHPNTNARFNLNPNNNAMNDGNPPYGPPYPHGLHQYSSPNFSPYLADSNAPTNNPASPAIRSDARAEIPIANRSTDQLLGPKNPDSTCSGYTGSKCSGETRSRSGGNQTYPGTAGNGIANGSMQGYTTGPAGANAYGSSCGRYTSDGFGARRQSSALQASLDPVEKIKNLLMNDRKSAILRDVLSPLPKRAREMENGLLNDNKLIASRNHASGGRHPGEHQKSSSSLRDQFVTPNVYPRYMMTPNFSAYHYNNMGGPHNVGGPRSSTSQQHHLHGNNGSPSGSNGYYMYGPGPYAHGFVPSYMAFDPHGYPHPGGSGEHPPVYHQGHPYRYGHSLQCTHSPGPGHSVHPSRLDYFGETGASYPGDASSYPPTFIGSPSVAPAQTKPNSPAGKSPHSPRNGRPHNSHSRDGSPSGHPHKSASSRPSPNQNSPNDASSRPSPDRNSSTLNGTNGVSKRSRKPQTARNLQHELVNGVYEDHIQSTETIPDFEESESDTQDPS